MITPVYKQLDMWRPKNKQRLGLIQLIISNFNCL